MTALSYRPFLLYFITNSISLLGLWIQKIGVGWLTWQLTESTFWTSFVTLALMAPAGILGPFFAVWAENWDMRRASIFLKLSMLLLATTVWYLQLLNLHTVYSLAILSIFHGILSAMYHPVRLVFVSVIVEKKFFGSAISLNSASFNASRVIGPSLAGFFIFFFNLEVTFFVSAISYLPLLPILCLIPLRLRTIENNKNEKFLKNLIDGLQVALKTKIIINSLIIVFVNAFFVRGILEIQPTIAGEVLLGSSTSLSVITATAGVGALLSSLWMSFTKFNQNNLFGVLFPMLLIGFISSLLIGLTQNLILISSFFLIMGFSTTMIGISSQTIIQLKVNDKYRARVLTWWSTISFGSLTLGGIILGISGEFFPIRFGIISMPILGFITYKYFFRN
ncbi:MAG: MFS transporter [SAR116 cluster bacterium]|jgi:MFS family permease|nr:MFS transporter [SAR116 cluster bacterium]|tara:strand:- start:1088 stop:2266 length:1179 start_codon:yes stop_codon:yes gene_type:complete